MSTSKLRVRPRLETLEDRFAPATLRAGFTEDFIASGLDDATAMEIAPDGRIWALEQAGDVEVFHAGSTTAHTALDIPAASINSDGERGLLGIAFAPDYNIASPAPDFVYLYYTSTAGNIHNRVSRYTVDNTDPDQPQLSGETVIVDLDPLSGATNHNGGAIHFGPDGKLYIAVGDNANGANAQTLSNRLGKMLRLNPDGSIPPDNPTKFAGVQGSPAGANRAIWALGLRNPFTFSFQPGSGRMFINDVGQNAFEEINRGLAGANYGWPATEGNFNPNQFPNFRRPFYAYAHGGGTFEGFAITGGAFYNPSAPGVHQFPASYAGDYFFADFVNDWINVIDLSTRNVKRFASGASGPVDLRVAPDGSLLYLSRGEGRVYQVIFSGNQTTFSANVNFQTKNSAGFPGYIRDVGGRFLKRSNGFSYGWNQANFFAVNRNAAHSPDERFDTFIHMQRPANPNAFWEIKVPSGVYSVRVVAGDPSSFKGVYRINVEGVRAVNGRPTSATRWLEGTVTVAVRDGRLTLTSARTGRNNKIAFIEISPAV
jgi:glucose/arabinose dehydrogenase